ncbi:MAG: hypothetical protein ABSF84_13325 [Acidimicrobiales bacterium]|jgi:hypothetical protein
MPDPTTPPPPANPQAPAPAAAGGIELTWKAVLVVAIVIGSIVAITLAIAFHYPKASDATSVLGVILPVFTAVLGAALGTGVGSAAGSAGKKAVEGQLSQSTQVISSIRSELPKLMSNVGDVFDQVKQGATSQPGEASFVIGTQHPGAVEPTRVDMAVMDDAAASLARMQGLLGTHPAS